MNIPKLDASRAQPVTYCIPNWLRDQQMLVNTKAVKGRIEARYELREEPIAVVCFGPSLRDTWEQVREFRYIITCSGAHRFLIERGIIPTFHVEVDPRPHKIVLLGEPHPEVEYLIASACHPDYFKCLEGYNVKLWHAFDANDEPLRMLPPGEWAITGGCDAGLRAMTIARFLGFRKLHIFGKDGSIGEAGTHADPHPNHGSGYALTEYEGVEYKTTPAFLEAARGTLHELDQMPDVEATFYGEGLVQAMFRHYQRKPAANKGFIAFHKPELISSRHRELNAQLHRERLEYGVGGGKHAEVVAKLRESCKAESVLDYGCGKGYLAKSLSFPIWEYDPAIPEKSDSPRPADLVVCTDVLEHIEKDKLPAVLDDLRRCTKKVGYFVIHTGPAVKTYADGSNTHLLQHGLDWWQKRVGAFFEIGKVFERGKELHFVVGPKSIQKVLNGVKMAV